MSKAQELALLRQTIYIPRGKVKYRYNPFPTSNKKQGNWKQTDIVRNVFPACPFNFTSFFKNVVKSVLYF